MQLIGVTYPEIRERPLERRFSRPTFQTAYITARKTVQSGDAAELQRIDDEGVALTNGDSHSARGEGAVRLIAVADKILAGYAGRRATRLETQDLNWLYQALKDYHFAANTFRQLQQFELSADYYVISAQVGDAVSQHLKRGRADDSKLIAKILDWTDRSYMRAGAVRKETGAENKVQDIFIANRDFRRRRHDIEGHFWKGFVLTLWSGVSRYGTSVKRIAACFVVWIVAMATVIWVYHPGLGYGAVVWDNLIASLGGTRQFVPGDAQSKEALSIIDGVLRIAGFVWTVLFGQLLVQRILVRS